MPIGGDWGGVLMCDTADDELPPREADRDVLRGMSPNGLNCDMKVYVAMPDESNVSTARIYEIVTQVEPNQITPS